MESSKGWRRAPVKEVSEIRGAYRIQGLPDGKEQLEVRYGVLAAAEPHGNVIILRYK
jgi:hypothetical protein